MTDRFGGVSLGAHATFNLGAGVNDSADAVAQNRAVLAEQFAVAPSALRFMKQEHGTRTRVLGGSRAGSTPACDAIITSDPTLALAVLVADCTPVLLLDRSAGWVGAVHAGRAGMNAGVVAHAVEALRERGATDLQAVVGPSICARCYEVPAAMRAQAAVQHPSAYAVSWSGSPAIDVAGAVVEQLHTQRIPVRWLPGCTRELPELYSHRGDPHTGRFAAVVRLRVGVETGQRTTKPERQ
ncbi:MAG: polyphenol oxidase family protein [Ornithinimicrobium sp.]